MTANSVSDSKSVILTFDDGPGKFLTQILDILKKEQVPAMFFWQTRLLYPQRPWQRVLNEGHVIGSHTVQHVDLTRRSGVEQLREIQRSLEQIEMVTGRRPRYFRPPFGQYNTNTITALRELDVLPVMWRIASLDWELKNDSRQIISNVTDNLEDGAIILLHELQQTVDVLPELIQAIKSQGYRFKLLDTN
ncbi:polysaccharide deacetylase family protein [Planococcus lenghuensis]|uniref:Polysaccharide deacetylase n=1 Tax=Planococcus lenghuensis TaxID=2213202 RepID=A0A1Q2KZF5_9BACL|nr:polysaccharide deacetylase family protein [Planococcus lenghuensis]AQQ53187.1 polysaccharide deacetylase [Planococcus lenghuensis]